MSAETSVTQEMKDLINEIIKKEKWNPFSEVSFASGSETGEGFLSKNFIVTVDDGSESTEIFLKCATEIKAAEIMPISKFYSNEIHFYEVVYPTYSRFLKEKNIEDGFRNVAKCYGTFPNKMVALENLKKKGFTLCNRTRPLNDEHITLSFETFAKFHAVSFAMKDQEEKEYDRLVKPILNVYDIHKNEALIEVKRQAAAAFIDSLHPIKDKRIIDGMGDLVSKLHNAVISSDELQNEYSIITQGDCWCNNMMYLYEDKNKENPLDIMVVDWQIIRTAMPVFDLSYFFLTVASEEALLNYKHYLKVYHDELTEQIRKLGSDPERLYPFAVLESQWKEHSKFGFAMALMMIRIMLATVDEAEAMEGIDFQKAKDMDLAQTLGINNEYIRRMKILAEYMVTNDFL